MADDPRVSIVIINWNGKDDLLRCLTSLRDVDYPCVETIVVDNGSTDGSLEALEKTFPAICRIAVGKNVGHAEGLNIGTRVAQGDFILHLDNDIRAHDPAFLKVLVRLMLSDATIGACGPMVLDMDSFRIQFLGEHILFPRGGVFRPAKGIGELDKGQYAEPFEVDYIRGCAILFRRAVLDEVGLYPPRYIVYFDEADLCQCIKKAGFRVVTEPRARIMHKVGGSGAQPSDFSLYLSIRNRLYFMRRHGNVGSWLAFVPRFLWNPLPWDGVRFLLRQPLRSARLTARSIWWNIKDITTEGWKGSGS